MLANISKKQKITVIIGVMLAMFLAALDQTIVATAMPKIVEEFHGLEHLSWVVTSYMLTSTVIVPIYGKLSDIYGRKYFIMSAIVIFIFGSILSGLSQSMFQLIVFRGIQGLGGGAIFANAFAVVGDIFPPRERGKWQGLFGAVFGVASVVGPLLGGWLTDNASWRWTFYINVPLGILALLVIGVYMPKIVPHAKNKYVDYKGAFFLATGLVLLLLGFVWGGNQYAWDSAQIIWLFAFSIISFMCFIFFEKRVLEPILPLYLFKNSIFTITMIVLFLVGVGMFGSIIYLPLFAQLVLGANATNAGTILTPMMLGIVFSSIVTGQVVSRTGKYKWLAVIGLALASASLYSLSTMTVKTSYEEMIIRMILTGVGIGVTFPIFTVIVQNAIEHSKLGVVTASTQLFRSIGATVGTAILGGVLNNNLTEQFKTLQSDTFVRMMAKANPQIDLSNIDANKVQGILSAQGKDVIQNKLLALPAPQAHFAYTAFQDFLSKAKALYATSIVEVFFVCSIVMAFAVFITLFLNEIPLRKTHE